MTPARRFEWRLSQVMHEHGIHSITELQRTLEEEGITLSSSQMHRLATQTPERLNLAVLSALCDILSCTPNDLIQVHQVARRAKAVNDPNVVDITTLRPKRARVTRTTEP